MTQSNFTVAWKDARRDSVTQQAVLVSLLKGINSASCQVTNLQSLKVTLVGLRRALLRQFPDFINSFWWPNFDNNQGLFGQKIPSLSCAGLTKQAFFSLTALACDRPATRCQVSGWQR